MKPVERRRILSCFHLVLAIVPALVLLAGGVYMGYIYNEVLITGFDVIVFGPLIACAILFVSVFQAVLYLWHRKKLAPSGAFKYVGTYWCLLVLSVVLFIAGAPQYLGDQTWRTFVIGARIPAIKALVHSGDYARLIDNPGTPIDGYQFDQVMEEWDVGVVFVTSVGGGPWKSCGLFVPFKDDGRFHEHEDIWEPFAGLIEPFGYDGVYWYVSN